MSDIYKIAVEIALAGSIVKGLEAISGKLFGIHTKVTDVEGGLRRWGLAITGVAATLGAGGIFREVEKAVEAGGDLVKQQAILLNMGVSQADVLASTAKAQQATHEVLGTTIADNIKGIRELMGVMPNLQEAQEKYVGIARGAKVLESLTGTPAEKSLQTLAKAVELRGGGVNPATGNLIPQRLESETQAAVRAIIASGGLVNQQQLLNMMQQAGPMARSVDNADVFYKGMLTAMMDMGGFRAGTALTAVGRQLLGGKMAPSTAEEMQRIGLLPAEGWHKAGAGVYVEPGALAGESILKSEDSGGVAKWFNDVLLPAFKEHGLTKNADVQQELYRLFGTETSRRLAGLFIQNKAQVERDAQLYDNALGGQAYDNIAKGDLGANIKNFSTSFQNLLQVLGAPLVPVATAALQGIASAVNSMADWVGAHPEAAKLIGEAAVGLAGAFAILGGAAIIAAVGMLIPGGAVALAVTTIAGIIGVIAAANWDGVATAISGVAIKFEQEIAALPGQVAGAISDAFASIGNYIKEKLSHLNPFDSMPNGPPPSPAEHRRTGRPTLGDIQRGLPPLAIPQSYKGQGVDPSLLHNINFGGPSPNLPNVNFGGQSPNLPNFGGKNPPDRSVDFRAPPKSQQPIYVTSKLNLDGRTLAQAMADRLVEMLEFPTSAPYWDGKRGFSPPDMQTTST